MIHNKGNFRAIVAKRAARGGHGRSARPLTEVLEGRQLLAVITVNSTGDADGADGGMTLSLRQAIEVANGTLAVGSLTASQASLIVGPLATPNTIDFNIAGAGPFTIMPATGLPAITSPVIINGYSQPGALPNTNGPGLADNAVIEIALVNGGPISSSGLPPGLDVKAGGSTVEGLAIGGFGVGYSFPSAAGIVLEVAGGNVVEGNFIGTDVTGTNASPNQVGISIESGGANTIGGLAAGARNVIAGNAEGVLLNSKNNLVEGNFVGTDATGTKSLSSQDYGVEDELVGSNTIGGTAAGAGNLISGNVQGLSLGGNDLVEGNFIGTDLTGTKTVPAVLAGLGITLYSGLPSTIGGTVAGAGNLISGNVDGINFETSGNLVEGNFIGTDLTGTKSIPNQDGITSSNGNASNTIGGTTVAARNVISGNDTGLDVGSDSLVEGNFIGTDPTGTKAVPNGDGIATIGFSNTIGGTVTGAANVISGNTGDGIDLSTLDNLVEGNFVGTDVTGTVALPNGSGIGIGGLDGSDSNTIGGTISGARNIISGNTMDGISFLGDGADNLVEGNYIGTDVTCTKAVPNATGLVIGSGGFNPSNSNTIGGTAAGSGNVISGNTQNGVVVGDQYSEPQPSANMFEGNFIGTDETGTVALPNADDGIFIMAGTSTTIGGTTAGAGNVISGNTQDGVDLGTTGSLVQGNFIGTDLTGTKALPDNFGVVLEDSDSNTIGGTAAGASNVISGNTTDGVLLYQTSTSNLLEGNFVGTDVTGSMTVPNSYGIVLEDSDSNTIGGTVANERNVVSGNTTEGILLSQSSSSDLMEGDFVGTDATGTKAIPNSYGIAIDSDSNTIGGTAAGAGNVVSGNTTDGIDLDQSSSSNLVEGDFVGTDLTGTKAIPNYYGILIASTSNSNTIGGTAAGARNVISGNTYDGLSSINSSSNNLVVGNFVGTDVTGTKAVPNATGIAIESDSNTIGGTVKGAGNVISGNTGDGLYIASDTNLVEGNLVGTDVTGTKALPNGSGIALESDSNTIGGTVAGARNVISGNLADGIILGDQTTNPQPSSNLIEGNLVGTDATGTVALPNSFNGVLIQGGTSNTIGGTAAVTRNVISGNTGNGLDLTSSSSDSLVEGNFIGTDLTGTIAVPNNTGIFASGSNTIGGTAVGSGNIISGNVTGIFSDGSAGLVEGNFIGTDVTGTKGIPNVDGIAHRNSGSMTIGGTTAGARNIISGNSYDGIDFCSGSSDNLVEGNFIGTDLTGTKALPNNMNGVEIDDSGSNTFGGTAAGAGNVIAFNGKAGVGIATVAPPTPPNSNDRITGNSIFANGGLGIDLGIDGVTPNNPAGSPTGPNLLQPYPVLTLATPTLNGPVISATLDASASKSYTVEFFANLVADSSGFGEGQTYLGSEVVTTKADGHVAFTFEAPLAAAGRYISATATDPTGNTSEFAHDLFAMSATTIHLGVPPGLVLTGMPITLVATVGAVPDNGTPTGEVEFTEDGQPIGSATLNASGSGSLTIPATEGAHTFAASFVGSTTDAGSPSSPVVVTVVNPSTTTALMASTSTATTGQPLTLTALVTAAQETTPTGVVDFTEDGQPIGSATLDASGSGSLTIPAPDGSHTFAAIFVGSTNDPGSASGPVVVTAVKQSTTTTLTGPPTMVTTDQSLTYTATVAGSVGAGPTGVVDFFEDGSLIGAAPTNSSGMATFTTNPFLPGLHVVTATYLGDPTHASSPSGSLAVNVVPTSSFGYPTVTKAQDETSTTVKVSFSRSLLLSTAQARANYTIVGPHKQAVTVKSAVYNAADDSVTLTTRQTLEAGQSYQLTVNGVRNGRIEDVYGIPLAGKQGKPGTNYVGSFTPKPPKPVVHHTAPKPKPKPKAPKVVVHHTAPKPKPTAHKTGH
jgi:Bacterial Ig-like domain (group 3)